MNILQVLHVSLIHWHRYFSSTHDHSLNALISSSCDLSSNKLGFVVNFDPSVVVAFFSSAAFFTASAADAVACVLPSTTSRISLIHSIAPEQYCPSDTMYEVCHQSSSFGFQRPQIYGSKRSRDPSHLGAFLWSSNGVTLILAPLPCELLLNTQRAAVK